MKMSTDVITNLAGSLDAELEQARATLREVDDGIKKLFGKENTADGGGGGGSSFGNRNSRSARNSQDYGGGTVDGGHFNERTRRRRGADEYDEAEPLDKRQRLDGMIVGKGAPMVIGPRIRPRLSSEDEEYRGVGGGSGRRLQSRIVTSGKEKSREEVLAEQREDKKGRDRNKRMFGALLGTLQRFKQDETKLKEKEDKRAQIEAKLDEAAKKERDEVRTKRQQLIRERKLRITEIKRLEIKRNRLADLAAWESKTKYLANFIRTEAKPHIFYLPKKLCPITECRLEQSKQYVTELIASKRKLVLEDLEDFEQRSKRYWERRLDGRETGRRADPLDEDIEEELKEIMKNDELDGGQEGEEGEEEMQEDDGERAVVEAVDFKVTVFTTSNTEDGSTDLNLTSANNKPHDNGEEEGLADPVRCTLKKDSLVEDLENTTIIVEVKREDSSENHLLQKMDHDDVEGASRRNNVQDDDDDDCYSAHSGNGSERVAEDNDDD